jgi:hypothetical protein
MVVEEPEIAVSKVRNAPQSETSSSNQNESQITSIVSNVRLFYI